ncbi:CHAP domain-containing protein [Pseudoroseomonas globiformis]|uniref:CHAP domain-containing protein n=1 Tax=Teichococcus globiformis TaxID=2307229 RepID=A0ABV7FXI5_9PROT
MAWKGMALAALLAVAGCGGQRTGPTLGAAALREPVSCVPYARARSGVDLRGDAWQWWEAAAGRYPRGHRPQPGSILVLQRSGRLRDGHLSVVTRLISSREILVDHANWASGAAKGRITTGQRVQDVSAANDWSLVRVWYPPVNDYGATAYPATGFVHGGTVLAGG